MKAFALAAAVILAGGLISPAGELGMPAAPLRISEWIKGRPVSLETARGKQILVVEFWASWVQPCRESIPHLTRLQKKFKDVVIIGVTDEESAAVKDFVTKAGDQLDYVVAIDDRGQTIKGYMKAFGVTSIPHAFIVDKEGKVVWHGHPLAELEHVLTNVIAGKFDVAKANQRDQAQQKLAAFYEAASKGLAEDKLEAMGKELEALDVEVGGFDPDQKFNAAEARKTVKFQGLLKQYQQALETQKDNATLAELEKQLEAIAPKNFALADVKESIALRKVFMNYYQAATGRRGADKLPQYTQELLDLKIQNAEALNQLAWTILTDENIKHRDLALATKLAAAGVAASDGKMAAVLDTYARALFDSGNVTEAIAQQKKALGVAKKSAEQEELERTLKHYQEKAAGKSPPGN